MWAVTWMSFFCSTSTLMVFSILPAYLVDVLHLGHARIGFMEGAAIALSFGAKFFSGILSDVMAKRKPLIVAGSVMSAMIKPGFALFSSAGSMFALRSIDRFAKGIRSSPTDALIADVSESKTYGDNFGKRQAMYTLGDVFGAICAMAIMLLSGNNYRLCFLLSFIPALFAVVILLFLVKPHAKSHPRALAKTTSHRIRLEDLKKFSSGFWWLQFALFFLMLSRFSETFLSLKAKDVGLAVALLPMVVICKDVIHALVAWPSGRYADRFSRTWVFGLGLLFMVLAQGIFALSNSFVGATAGVVALGVHLGFSQGLFKALMAQDTPPELRGTAYSLFCLFAAVAIFLGNTVAGALSQAWGINAAFLGGGLFSLMSFTVVYYVFIRPERQSKKPRSLRASPA